MTSHQQHFTSRCLYMGFLTQGQGCKCAERMVHACRDMEAAPGLMLHEEEPPAKFARTSPAGSRSTNRHIQTEQRRRDRINEGCAVSQGHLPQAFPSPLNCS